MREGTSVKEHVSGKKVTFSEPTVAGSTRSGTGATDGETSPGSGQTEGPAQYRR